MNLVIIKINPHFFNLQVGEEDHPEFQKIVELIPSIMFKGQSAKITTPIDLQKLLPGKV